MLAKKHGTPAEFAAAVYLAVPGYISMDEAAEAVTKYNREWVKAALHDDAVRNASDRNIKKYETVFKKLAQ
jgi:hypothetical protein